MLYLSVLLWRWGVDMNPLRYPIPKSLSSGKGLMSLRSDILVCISMQKIKPHKNAEPSQNTKH